MKHHLVAALAYEGLCTFEFGCAVEVFDLARPELGVDWYDFAVCAEERHPLRAAGGVCITAGFGLELLARADTIVIPGWRGVDQVPSDDLLRALRVAHARGARLASICSGVFVLAAAGLLDGLGATTHWRYASVLAQRYPLIEVRPNALYVDEGQILTSAGSAAGLDMLIHLVRKDHGARIANQVAQRLVIAPHRVGDQAQFVARPVAGDEAGRLAKLMDWVRGDPGHSHTLASMAARASMSIRTLQRQFVESTGLPPLQWVIAQRIALAKDLLQSRRSTTSIATNSSITQIAERAGFASEESFRRHFRRMVGVSPRIYQQQFAGVTT